MKYFSKLSIQNKLRWLQVIVIVGLLSIASAFAVNIYLTDKFDDNLSKLNRFTDLTNKAQMQLLTARQIEKDFFISKNPETLRQFNSAIDALSTTLNQLDERWHGYKQTVHINASNIGFIHEAIIVKYNYKAMFTAATSQIIELGLSHDTGLLGQMHHAGHEIEELLEEELYENTHELQNAYHELHALEKEFLLHEIQADANTLLTQADDFINLISQADITDIQKAQLLSNIESYKINFDEYAQTTKSKNAKISSLKTITDKISPIFDGFNSEIQTLVKSSSKEIDQIINLLVIAVFVMMALVALVTAPVLFFVAKTITTSLRSLSATIEEISAGNYSARTNLESNDELGNFSRTFDSLLEERVSTLAASEQENEVLNNSIIDLMESVSDLAMRDLTVKATVAEDVTGPVADAINMMSSETASVLKNIKAIAAEVETTALSVNDQSKRVTQLASDERVVVSDTMIALDKAAHTMKQIVIVANNCNLIAKKASSSTTMALDSVTDTSKGMKSIRLTTSESEKRIKRLGERSQEINSVVEIINNIAERTHVLALNASMQAAAAGDAGRGFAVVAAEVQRLAVSSRQSTSEISALVSNIQAETAEAMTSMNQTISQVVSGTELAELSGKQMMDTQTTTEQLAKAVEKIAIYSQKQARINEQLKERAGSIVTSTEQSSLELETQAKQTHNLTEFADRLVTSVGEFKLPV